MAEFGADSNGPPEITNLVSLKVDNLSYETTVQDLQPIFDKYGEVGDIYIPREKDKQRSRGFAFVRYNSQEDADAAIAGLDGTEIDGRAIDVKLAQYARPKYDRSQRARRVSDHNGDRDGRRNYRSRSSSWDRERYRERYNRDHYHRERDCDRYASRYDAGRYDYDRYSSHYSPEYRRSRMPSPPPYRRRAYSPLPPPIPPPPPRYGRSPPRPPMPMYSSRRSYSPPPRLRSYSPPRRY